MFDGTGLTELEIKVMEAARRTDYGDCMEAPIWSFAVCDAAGLEEKVYRGVVASLVKKGLISIWDHGNQKRSDEMVFSYNDVGRKRFSY